MKYFMLIALLFSSGYAQAFTLVCTNKNKTALHQIQVKWVDEAMIVSEQWNGPYKTTARASGNIVRIDPSYLKLSVNWIQNTHPERYITFILREDLKSATLFYYGFLAPDTQGVVDMDCE